MLTEFIKKYKNNPQDLYNILRRENISLSEKINEYSQEKNNNNFNKIIELSNLKLKGKYQDTIEKMYQKATFLIPALVEYEISKGMTIADRFNYKDIIAATIPTDNNTANPTYIQNMDTDTNENIDNFSISRKTSGANIKKINVFNQEKNIKLKDYGIGIDVAYKTMANMPWQLFAVILNFVGALMSTQKLADIYQLGTIGDGTTGVADNIFTGTTGELGFADMVSASGKFNAPFSMNTILADINSYSTLLDLSRFNVISKDNETLKMITSYGAQIKQINSTKETTIVDKECVLLDKNFAVIENVNMGLTIESEKIINKKIEETIISDDTVFSILADGAIKRLIWHA